MPFHDIMGAVMTIIMMASLFFIAYLITKEPK